MNVEIRCPSGCGGVNMASCLDHEHQVVCINCGESFLFFNKGVISCTSCKEEIVFDLTTSFPMIYCNHCRLDVTSTIQRPPVPFRHEHEDAYQYCGLDHIQGHEEQVANADKAFRLVKAAESGNTNRRFAYIEVIKIPNDVGLKYIRLVHIACNFKFNPEHHNAKLMSFLYEKPLAKIMADLAGRRGVTTVWFGESEARKALEAMPSLEVYKPRFRDLPGSARGTGGMLSRLWS